MKASDNNQAVSLGVLIAGLASKANEWLADWLSTVDGVAIVGAETEVVKALVATDLMKPDAVASTRGA